MQMQCYICSEAVKISYLSFSV
uniref:Uncharacterized protein n=1 Tax=Anguilla anguilla TaxID=7936 RepID=A0A0E9W2Y8_ANGAN